MYVHCHPCWYSFPTHHHFHHLPSTLSFAPPSVLLPPQRSHEKPWVSTTGATNLSWRGSSSIFLNSTNHLHHLWKTSNRGFKSSKIRKDFFGGDGNFWRGLYFSSVWWFAKLTASFFWSIIAFFSPLRLGFSKVKLSGLKPEKNTTNLREKKGFAKVEPQEVVEKLPRQKSWTSKNWSLRFG